MFLLGVQQLRHCGSTCIRPRLPIMRHYAEEYAPTRLSFYIKFIRHAHITNLHVNSPGRTFIRFFYFMASSLLLLLFFNLFNFTIFYVLQSIIIY